MNLKGDIVVAWPEELPGDAEPLRVEEFESKVGGKPVRSQNQKNSIFESFG